MICTSPCAFRRSATSYTSSKGPLKEKVEIQLRTVAMDYWSVLEYQIFYKKTENEEVAKELKTYADEISELDAKMLKLRDKIEKM